MIKKIQHIVREENFLSLAGNLVVALFGLAGFSLLARTLAAPAFGQWVLFIAAGSLVEMLRSGLTTTALVRYLAGADAEMQRKLTGSHVLIGLLSTIALAAIIAICNLAFGNLIENSGYGLFFRWYPLLALAGIPMNNALALLQADRQFGRLLLIRFINSSLFFAALVYHTCINLLSPGQLVCAFIAAQLVSSLLCVFRGWDGLKQLRNACVETNSLLLRFGKYTILTLVGTNLLRSADLFIISLSPLGSAGVAAYSIPLKLTELQQIPLRSFTATAFPKMAKASLQGNNEEVKMHFYTYTGAITLLFIAGNAICFLFAQFFVNLLGGGQYASATGIVAIVQVFALYGLLLPMDRMTGIGLDSINKPGINARKVFIMLVANITGDLLAVFFFQSLLLVAVSSVAFTLVGIYVGMRMLNKELGLGYTPIFSNGVAFYKSIAGRITSKKFQAANPHA